MADNSVKKSDSNSGKKSVGFLGRILLFIKQVIAELKKVVYPTKNELWTYFWVVIVFVLMIMAFVGVFDGLLNVIVRLVFG
ncbi:preprotein translocase subunit SecE [Actinomyces sp. zg-332]|uniref:preprotein translocase subunit SecE n=1 Tax=Actinomyces sp. zg-332 TaxID=2708340 RepID=UPI001423542B|nr:preprotein translocase subunit SecE [Actinomyces sp. zg-332]QPK93999.1 preprotein translocase subunit SecE [Actinomyces sp. zg-332]